MIRSSGRTLPHTIARFSCIAKMPSTGAGGWRHGLPLMGTGDWNDGMNLVGAEGQGESVWLGWFLFSMLTIRAARRAAWRPVERRRLR